MCNSVIMEIGADVYICHRCKKVGAGGSTKLGIVSSWLHKTIVTACTIHRVYNKYDGPCNNFL